MAIGKKLVGGGTKLK